MKTTTSGPTEPGDRHLQASVVVLGAIYGMFLVAVIVLNVAVL